ncbi:MAG TPA: thermonuclease family protein [Armatimonadota bacterium]|nr:thermonuclease family protein [Armatimonadota bacterium]
MVQRTSGGTESMSGRVVAVGDGDTLRVLVARREVKVRLYGIDSPEAHQAFGTQAKKFTSQKAFGKTVTVEVRDTDQYGRTVGEVILPDGTNLNALIVKSGYAWAYRHHSRKFIPEEEEAKADRRGLWKDRNPIPPWEFRRAN